MEQKANINFKGFAIANGALDIPLLVETSFQYSYNHGIIGDRLWQKLQSSCCKGESCLYINSTNPECIDAQQEAKYFLNNVSLNPYDMTGDCTGSYSSERNSFSMLNFPSSWKYSIGRPGLHSAFLPCIETTHAETYMNMPQVLTALHIPNSLTQKWTSCKPVLAANYTTQYLSMHSQFVALLPNYRALVFNGDAGNVCNFHTGQKFAASLTQPVVGDRRPWRYQGQVAGFVTEYKQLSFITAKNSGHMVPMYTPGPALQMITNFLKDQPQ